MELSMSMRYVRIRARQKAGNGPVYAEHVMSTLLMLAGSDAQSVMQAGTDAAKAAIAHEITVLRAELERLYGLGDPLSVMARLDELIAVRELETGAGREFAALQSDAEKWMSGHPGHGDMIVPVAMLYAVRDKTDLIVEEAMMTVAGGASGNAADSIAVAPATGEETVVDLPDSGATAVDFPSVDPDATIVDFDPEKDAAEAAEKNAAEAAKQKAIDDAARREQEDRQEKERRKREEADKREQERIDREAREKAERERAAAEEALKLAILQKAAEEQLRMEEQIRIRREREEQEAARRRNKKSGGKSFVIFLVFAIVVFAAWRLFLYFEASTFGGDAPWWMKIVFFVVYIIAFGVSLNRISAMQAHPDIAASQTTMMRIRVVGTAGMIYFRFVILSTIFPAVLLLILNLVTDEMPAFWYHFLSIYCFCWLCSLVHFAFQSNVSALSVGHLSWPQLKKKKAAMVGMTVSGVLMVPAVVIFLHWHFDWFPMKTWVIVVLIIYLVLGLISCITIGRANANHMQNG